ncbi:MAG: hypothetical protein ACK46Q_16160 [Hyphomonas sp.]
MKTGWAIGLAALGLAACGSAGVSDRQALVDSCVARGEAPASCACLADAFETNLPPELFRKTAERVGRQGIGVEVFIRELEVEEMLAFSAAVEDMMACPLSGQGA